MDNQLEKRLKVLYGVALGGFGCYLFGATHKLPVVTWTGIATGLPSSIYLCAKIPNQKELEQERQKEFLGLRDQLAKLQSERDWLEQLNQGQAQKLLTEHGEREARLRDRISELTNEIENIRSSHLDKLAELQLDSSDERGKLEENYRLQIARKQAEINKLMQQLDSDKQLIIQQSEQEKEQLKSEYETAITALQEEFEKYVVIASEVKETANKRVAEAEAYAQKVLAKEQELKQFEQQLQVAEINQGISQKELYLRETDIDIKAKAINLEIEKRLMDESKKLEEAQETITQLSLTEQFLTAELAETKAKNQQLWMMLFGKETDNVTAAVMGVLAANKCPCELISSDCETIVLRPTKADEWDKKSIGLVMEKMPAFVPGLTGIPSFTLGDGTIKIKLNYQDETEPKIKLYSWDDAKTEASGFVICGNTGAAKTATALWLLGLLTEDKPKQVLILDVHAQMNGWNQHGLYTLHRQQDVIQGLQASLNELIRRKENGINYPELIVVFDEIAATRMNCEDKEEKAFVDSTMLLLGAEGRKFGIILIAINQSKNTSALGIDAQNRNNYFLVLLCAAARDWAEHSWGKVDDRTQYVNKKAYSCVVSGCVSDQVAFHPTHGDYKRFQKQGLAPKNLKPINAISPNIKGLPSPSIKMFSANNQTDSSGKTSDSLPSASFPAFPDAENYAENDLGKVENSTSDNSLDAQRLAKIQQFWDKGETKLTVIIPAVYGVETTGRAYIKAREDFRRLTGE